MSKSCKVVWFLEGEGICSQSGFPLPTTTIGIVSVGLHLLLPFCFCIVNDWGTVWGNLTIVFASACVSSGTHVPV